MVMKDNELFNVISQQSDYIDQLEKNNLFLKYELGKFQADLKNVVEENEMLYKESQSVLARATLAESHKIALKTKSLLQNPGAQRQQKETSLNKHGDGTETANQNSLEESNPNWKAELENIKSMYTAEISKLKQELLSSQQDLKLERQTAARLKTEETPEESAENYLDDKARSHKGTDQNQMHIKSKAMVDSLLEERKQLLGTITGLNQTVSEYRNQENVLRKEVQKSFVSLEEMELENSHLKHEKTNMAENLKVAHDKLEECMNDTQRLIQEALEQHKLETSTIIAKLKREISELELTCSKSKLSQERMEKQNLHLQSTLQEVNEQLLLKKRALTLLRTEAHTEVQNTARANDATELELRDTKLRLENELQIEKQEKAIHQQKSIKLSQRLEESQREALKIQQLNVSLIDESNDMHMQLNAQSKKLSELQKTFSSHYEDLKKNYTEQFSKQANSLELIEENYGQRLQEVEALSAKQAELNNKLKMECFSLEAELASISHKYEKDIAALSQTNMELLVRARNLVERNEELTTQCVQHGLAHRNMKKHMTELNINAQKSTSHMINTLSKELTRK